MAGNAGGDNATGGGATDGDYEPVVGAGRGAEAGSTAEGGAAEGATKPVVGAGAVAAGTASGSAGAGAGPQVKSKKPPRTWGMVVANMAGVLLSIFISIQWALKPAIDDIKKLEKESRERFDYWNNESKKSHDETTEWMEKVESKQTERLEEMESQLKDFYDLLDTESKKSASFFRDQNDMFRDQTQREFESLLSVHDKFNERIKDDFDLAEYHYLLRRYYHQNEFAYENALALLDHLIYVSFGAVNVHIVEPSRHKLEQYRLLNVYMDTLLTLEKIANNEAEYDGFKEKLIHSLSTTEENEGNNAANQPAGSPKNEVVAQRLQLSERHLYAAIRAKLVLAKREESSLRKSTLYQEAESLLARYENQYLNESYVSALYDANGLGWLLLPEDDYPPFLDPTCRQAFDIERCQSYAYFLRGTLHRSLTNNKQARLFYDLARQHEASDAKHKWPVIDGTSDAYPDSAWTPYRFLLVDYMNYIQLETATLQELKESSVSELQGKYIVPAKRLTEIIESAGDIPRYRKGTDYPLWVMGQYEYASVFQSKDGAVEDQQAGPRESNFADWNELESVYGRFHEAFNALSDMDRYFLKEHNQIMVAERACLYVMLRGYDPKSWPTEILGTLDDNDTMIDDGEEHEALSPYVKPLAEWIRHAARVRRNIELLRSSQPANGNVEPPSDIDMTNHLDELQRRLYKALDQTEKAHVGYPAGIFLLARIQLDKLFASKDFGPLEAVGVPNKLAKFQLVD